METSGRRKLKLVSLGVRVDLDDDRTAEIRVRERDDLANWIDTFAAVAAGREVFVAAQFFAVYAEREQPSFGATWSWHTLSTERDVAEDLVQLASSLYENYWTTEIADMRIAGWAIERPDYRPAEATVCVSRRLAQRLDVSVATIHGARPTWGIVVADDVVRG